MSSEFAVAPPPSVAQRHHTIYSYIVQLTDDKIDNCNNCLQTVSRLWHRL